ncbi:MAG: BrnT family toxin [Candidatus Daviesbacteria bacterium]|nr:MAG: BrnT family toxin [Candidatus Daviesbacteria bacterium]
MRIDKNVVAFEWDDGNSDKPKKHSLTLEETEESFLDENKIIFADWEHSTTESRITLLGKTKKGRLLNITYTVRKNKVRIITARPINRKEVPLYEKTA